MDRPPIAPGNGNQHTVLGHNDVGVSELLTFLEESWPMVGPDLGEGYLGEAQAVDAAPGRTAFTIVEQSPDHDIVDAALLEALVKVLSARDAIHRVVLLDGSPW